MSPTPSPCSFTRLLWSALLLALMFASLAQADDCEDCDCPDGMGPTEAEISFTLIVQSYDLNGDPCPTNSFKGKLTTCWPDCGVNSAPLEEVTYDTVACGGVARVIPLTGSTSGTGGTGTYTFAAPGTGAAQCTFTDLVGTPGDWVGGFTVEYKPLLGLWVWSIGINDNAYVPHCDGSGSGTLEGDCTGASYDSSGGAQVPQTGGVVVKVTISVGGGGCVPLEDGETCIEVGGDDCGVGDCGDGEQPADTCPTSESPVSLITGHKTESTADLVVSLPGRDYVLTREYTSDPDWYPTNSSGDYFWNGQYGSTTPGRLGAGWNMNGERYLQGVQLQNGVPDIMYLRGASRDSARRFDRDPDSLSNIWIEHGSGNNWIEENLGTVYRRENSGGSGGTTVSSSENVLQMARPGGGAISFVGYIAAQPAASTFEALDLSGKIVAERDKYGNSWVYEWSSLGESSFDSRDVVRLRAIYLGGSPGSELARVEFHWHGDPTAMSPYSSTASTDPRYGRLAEVEVIREDSSSQDVVTQGVRYIYFDDVASDTLNGSAVTLGDVYDASEGDLIEVICSKALTTSGQFHDRVYQYRYYTADNNDLGGDYDGLGLVDLAGREHQLMAVIYPEQIEYYADYVIQEAERQNGTSGTLLGDDTTGLYNAHYGSGFAGAPDAAELLRWVRFDNTTTGHNHPDATALLLANDRWNSLYDIAGKIISYYPDSATGGVGGRVRTQLVSSGDGASGCGCSSATPGINLGKRLDYIYRRFVYPTSIAPLPFLDEDNVFSNGYSCQIVESTLGFSGSLAFTPYRVECHDYLWPSPLRAGDIADGANLTRYPAVRKIATATVPANPDWNHDPYDFSVNNEIFSATGNRWATAYDYDFSAYPTDERFTSYRKINRVLTPAAIGDTYEPAGQTSDTDEPDWDNAPTSGLVLHYDYSNQTGWMDGQSVSDGVGGTQEEIASFTRSATTRPDLATQVVRNAGVVPTLDPALAIPAETTTITRGYRGGVGGSAPSGAEANAVVAWERVKREAESEEQNGPAGTVDYSSWRLWDDQGQLRWMRDEAGTLTCYAEYDANTGVATRIIRDADPSGAYATGVVALTSTNFPGLTSTNGWSVPSRSDYEELEDAYEVDLLGRVIEREDPGGVKSYMRYETRVAKTVDDSGMLVDRGIPYWSTVRFPHGFVDGGTHHFDGPIHYSTATVSGKMVASESYIALPSGGSYDPTQGQFSLGSLVAKSDTDLQLSGVATESRVWHDADATSPADGSYTTEYKYDPLGRVREVIDPEGGSVLYGWKSSTATESGYDLLDRETQMSVGLASDTDSFRRTARYYYDSAQGTTQGVGNGNLTRVEQYTGESTGGTRVTRRWYDHRDRMTGEAPPELPYMAYAHDNLDRVIEEARITSATGFTDGADGDAIPRPSDETASRSTYKQALYNNRGMVYRARIAVDPGTGSAPTAFLESSSWFDARGDAIASWSPNGPGSKTEYDALRRVKTAYTTDRSGDAVPGTGSHASASTVAGDRIIQQTEYAYVADNQSGAGATELVTNRMRLHNYAGTDPLDGSNSIAMFTLTEFDDASRGFKTHRYGVNGTSFTSGTSAPSRPSVTAGAPDTGALVTEVGFDLWGRTVLTTSPDSQTTRSMLDSMSRQTATVEGFEFIDDDDIDLNTTTDNWEVDWAGSPYGGTGGPDDADRVTTYFYDGNSNVVKRSAHFGDGTMQTTQYVYGTTIGAGASDSLIASSNLLQKVHYPDETTGAASTQAEYTVVYGYNRLGELRGMLDQNQTTHAYTRDDLGRVTSDAVTITNSDLDGTITEIATSYDTHGRVSQVLSKNGSTTKNGVAFGYTGLHQVESVAQNPDGDPLVSGTPTVGYEYENAGPSASGDNYSRISEVVYPTEYDTGTTATETVIMDYGASGSIDDRISRVAGLEVDGWDSMQENLVDYSFLGAGLPVKVHYPRPTEGLGLDYTKAFDGTDGALSGTYHGFDQYGRVVWHPWVSNGYTTGTNAGFADRTPLVARSYEYDKDSNRTRDYDGRPGAVPSDRDWKYDYDDLDRLTTALRGQQTPGSGVDDFTVSVGSENWDLDILGNWEDFGIDTGGVSPVAWSATENRTRTHNMANEILTREGEPGAGPGGTTQVFNHTYDDNGNFRSNVGTASSNSLKYTHDAWNRLVKVERWVSGGSDFSILENEYNGLNWRVKRRMDLATGAYDGIDEEREYYYSPSWQLLEERIDRDFVPGGTNNTIDERAQQFWGVRYIDDAVARRLDRDNDGVWTEAANDNWYYLTDAMYSVRGIADNDGQIHTRVDYTPYGVAMHRYAADANNSGAVDFVDNGIFLANFNGGTPLEPGDTGYDPDADLNGDGFAAIGFTELNTWLGRMSYSTSSALNAGWIDNPSDANGPDNSVGYDGYWFDLAGASDARSTGVYCVRYRTYDPGMGRWTSRDPIGYIDGSLLYAYVRSRPTRDIDPYGMMGAPAAPRQVTQTSYTDCDPWRQTEDSNDNPSTFTAKRDVTKFTTITIVGPGKTGPMRNGSRETQMDDGSILIPNPLTMIKEEGSYVDGTAFSGLYGECFKTFTFTRCCETECRVTTTSVGQYGSACALYGRMNVRRCSTRRASIKGAIRTVYNFDPGSATTGLSPHEHQSRKFCDIPPAAIETARRSLFKKCESLPSDWVQRTDYY